MAHPLLQFFTYEHLPPRLKAVSQAFAVEAGRIDDCPGPCITADVLPFFEGLYSFVEALPGNTEREEALRKMRAVRSFARGYGTEAGGMGKGGALRLLLEAKDCAVRAVLFK
jgi:hypothetical protein